MHWLLIGYMFLFIHRPFEIWPALGDIHFERMYMLLTLAVWAVYPGKRILTNFQQIGYALFAAAVILCWAMSPWSEHTQPYVEDWLKIVVFYVLLVTTVHDEEGLKRFATAFIAVMGIYLTHSLREYIGGRHTYRMGIARMIGVDSSLGDPNSFGAGIVYALPFVTALWRIGVAGRLGKFALGGYVGLSALCILLTGSRSSLLGLGVWSAFLVFQGEGGRRRLMMLMALLFIAPVGFLALPESLQTRFETIVNPDVGPENAKVSGEGRIEGLFTGLHLFANNPISGVGPGAWRPATHSPIESHNLYGQLLGETGVLGGGAFLMILAGFWLNWRRIYRVGREHPKWRNETPFQVASAVGTAVLLMLFMGNFGHNLFRFNWLWFGGFLIIARHCVERRLVELDDEEEHPTEEAAEELDEDELDEDEKWVEEPEAAYQYQ